jgi:hypothetical protein
MLLKSRRTLETMRVDATQKVGLEIHSIEGGSGFVQIGLDVS